MAKASRLHRDYHRFESYISHHIKKMKKICTILIFLFFCFCLYFFMFLIQVSNDKTISGLEKQVELELIETKNKKHIDSH